MLNLMTVAAPLTRLLAQLLGHPRHPAAHTLPAHAPLAPASGLGEFPCAQCGILQSEAAPLCVACMVAQEEDERMRASDTYHAMYAEMEAAWFAAQVERTSSAPLTPDQRFEALGQLPTLEADLRLELRRLEAVRQGHWLALTGQPFSS
ncbi:hypothetical protein DGo_PB0259 (plasmid) [Deinococcus gobiensis I-0]|uniref:Uncharacterized protein n=2 Tax=Deinococcus TaxID=1298 RepID=H8H1Y1_DEIGI|nr:hypothetical protein DGo_PB0259 [Deinococcus gobiensis I-0]